MFNKFKMWIPVILAIGWTLYLNEWSKQITYKLLTGDITGAYEFYQSSQEHNELISEKNESKERLFSKEELSRHNNLENGLYLSIMGQVFNVTKGEQYYAVGATYHAFTGRDASLAFITGNFTDEGLIDDTSSLTNSQAQSIENWLKTYQEKYEYKGKLIGRYYDQDGHPTEDLQLFALKVQQAKEEKSKEDETKRLFPPCNIEWKQEKGSRVWCTNQSGGISRDWIGVPRQYFENPVGKSRCACVRIDSREYLENEGRFRNYKNCAEDSVNCFIET